MHPEVEVVVLVSAGLGVVDVVLARRGCAGHGDARAQPQEAVLALHDQALEEEDRRRVRLHDVLPGQGTLCTENTKT